MRILFVTLRAPEINSSVTISNLGILTGLKKLGHEVTLLTPEVEKNNLRYESVDKYLQDINVIRFGRNQIYDKIVSPKYKQGIRKKIIDSLRYLYYKFSVYDNTINIVNEVDKEFIENNNFDIVISTSDPRTSHKYVKNLIKDGLQYDYWIQHWGDPIYNDITNSNWIPKPIIKTIEKNIIKEANQIIYVSPFTAKYQRKIFPEYKNKINFIPLPYLEPKKYLNQRKINKIRIGYFGDYNSKIRDILPLYNFCKKNKNYELVIAGTSDLSLEETENIKILPRINQEKVNELESECDILAVVCNSKGTQIPGKLYYYAGTNKKILVLVDGEFSDEIEEYLLPFNRFILCNNSIENLTEKMYEVNPEISNDNPSSYFSPETIANQILSLFENDDRRKM